jgi:hypothetical protein
MPYERRDLTLHDPLLSGGTCLLTLSFEKSFARKPAYWLEVYCVPAPKKTSAYFFTRQWNFVRDGENVVEHAPGRRNFSLPTACEEFRRIAQQKLSENWVISGPAIVDAEASTSEQHCVNNMLTSLGTWINTNDLGVDSEAQAVNVSEPVQLRTRAERFSAAEKKRKAKAVW